MPDLEESSKRSPESARAQKECSGKFADFQSMIGCHIFQTPVVAIFFEEKRGSIYFGSLSSMPLFGTALRPAGKAKREYSVSQQVPALCLPHQ
jgi:hypothetical protein